MRFVVLHHTGFGADHFDLMYETAPGSMLRTWRLEHWPPVAKQRAVRIGDHRREYLEYEGELTGGRGRVRRVAGGECRVQELANVVRLATRGGAAIICLQQEDGENWIALAA